MKDIERRLRRLLDEANAMRDALMEGGSGAIFEPSAFRAFRIAAVTALKDGLGILHPYTLEFEAQVTGSHREAVIFAIGLLASALSDVEGERATAKTEVPFDSLLHPVVQHNALAQFDNGHYRDAIFNSMVAVFDLIRERTGLQTDGDALITRALSLERPRLVFADQNNKSGQNEQRGFMHILQGAYLAVRNPKAHSLRDQPTREITAQYMVFASLLARRITEAEIVEQDELS